MSRVDDIYARRAAGYAREIARSKRYEELRLLSKEALLARLAELTPDVDDRWSRATLITEILEQEIP